MTTFPPGPRDRIFGLSYVRRFRRHPLGFIAEVARKYGDFAFARVGWFRVYFVHRPELIREILATKMKSFSKQRRQMRSLGAIEGDGMVVAGEVSWKRHRPLVQANFHATHLERYASLIVEHARRRVGRWPTNAVLDLGEEMNHLTLEIIARIVFDVDWSDRAARLREAVESFRE